MVFETIAHLIEIGVELNLAVFTQADCRANEFLLRKSDFTVLILLLVDDEKDLLDWFLGFVIKSNQVRLLARLDIAMAQLSDLSRKAILIVLKIDLVYFPEGDVVIFVTEHHDCLLIASVQHA